MFKKKKITQYSRRASINNNNMYSRPDKNNTYAKCEIRNEMAIVGGGAAEYSASAMLHII